MSKVRAKSQLTKYQLHKKANESRQYDVYMSKHGLTERSRAYYAKRHNDHLNSDTLFARYIVNVCIEYPLIKPI